MPSSFNTQTDTLTGVSSAAENPGGMTMDNTTIGATVPKPGTFTALNFATDSVSVHTSTGATLSTSKVSILASSSAATFVLPAPGVAGVFKYISKTSTSTNITVTSSGSFIGSTSATTLTFVNASEGISLVSSSATQWCIVGLSTVAIS